MEQQLILKYETKLNIQHLTLQVQNIVSIISLLLTSCILTISIPQAIHTYTDRDQLSISIQPHTNPYLRSIWYRYHTTLAIFHRFDACMHVGISLTAYFQCMYCGLHVLWAYNENQMAISILITSPHQFIDCSHKINSSGVLSNNSYCRAVVKEWINPLFSHADHFQEVLGLQNLRYLALYKKI